ncbi:SH3 beta-barrel fold-containing protein [Telluribacter sp.]|jgi:hypothetical protein|uniref:SH3 beta-barrel fold-containing protein n=1 Tax=Telluribacter sp. TaxID=1978767 RepID=UPI002E11B5BB|nr:SH3 beta-barrel fold-containing protein [Telluribacter sp.]
MKDKMPVNRTELFTTAWAIRPECTSFAEALRKAWASHKLRVAMNEGIVAFLYKKKDGSFRPAAGTLQLNLLSKEYTPKSEREPQPTVLTYFDAQRLDWRSCKVANLLLAA